jgi:hypothetical protein
MDVAEWIDSGGAAAWRLAAGDTLLGGYARLITNDRPQRRPRRARPALRGGRRVSGCTCEVAARLCAIHGDGTQPLPVGNELPVAHRMVQDDLDERLALGLQRYGQPLQPFNGRNQLRDAYEEALDLCVYLRSALYEQEHR